MWVDGFCAIFPEDLGLSSALDSNEPLDALGEQMKKVLSRNMALLVSFYRISADEIECLVTKAFPQ